jgi:FAD/FMN-containing dehydrogenase
MAEKWNRRRFLNTLALAGVGSAVSGCIRPLHNEKNGSGIIVNDVHSRLTPTRVDRILRPQSKEELIQILRKSLRHRNGISVAGGRHSMGSQPFGTDTVHIDMMGVNTVRDFDQITGIVEVDAGTVWGELMHNLDQRQVGSTEPWCIRQKQTGADALTLGGALAANIHGRGLTLAPFVNDVESFNLLTASGDEILCSRSVNPDWFALAIGGYGLFGIVTSLRLRLMRRVTVRREVRLETVEAIPARIERKIAEGCLYGDFQFSTANETDGFLRDGVLSVYRPISAAETSQGTPPAVPAMLSTEHWKQLITLAHVDKARAFRTYLDYYLTTDGQLYDSDRQQMSTYLPDYHEVIAQALGSSVRQSLVITELYVPRDRLVDFMDAVRTDMRKHNTDLVYGVVRWIESDKETALPWAKQPYACVIFNLNVQHGPAGEAVAAAAFRRLIDRALERNGSYYLTYHRHADRARVEAAYPQFSSILTEKEQRDPRQVWNSDWYRHYRDVFA